MLESQRIYHRGEKQDQRDLNYDVETNPDPANFGSPARTWWFGCLSHFLEPPFPELEGLIREHKGDNGHARVENDWSGIDDTARERAHVFDGRKISQQIARRGGYGEQNELYETEEK